MIDLVPQQSLVKWLVEEGRTVFVISWVNPGPELKDRNVGDYVIDGVVAAVDEVKKRTGSAPDLFSFCIGGTLAAIALAWLAGNGRGKDVNSATLIGSMVDFADMHERHEGMELIGKTNKLLKRALDATAPDLASAKTAAATMNGLAHKAGGWFPAGTGPELGKTGAKPEIWQQPKDFAAKLKAFQLAAASLNKAAQGGNAAETTAAYGELGKTCKACHDTYRKDMHH